ncbi:MAG: hypothetical protein M3Q14_03565 [bacterium]|nr:hypothetical protein [bacterium]
MAERLNHHPEQIHSPELSKEQDKEVHKPRHEHHKPVRHEHADQIEVIRAKAEHEAEKHKTDLEHHTNLSHEAEKPMFINRELKSMAYQRTMKRVRRHLPLPARAFSKVIHQPAVEATSEAIGKTVARPSGVLAGGISAFIGSSIFLWISRHYGYEYNFLLFALLFAGGFFVGLLIEAVIRTLRRSQS